MVNSLTSINEDIVLLIETTKIGQTKVNLN